ncbi:MAG TPA: LemA family protein [Actinomycetota bacterium]|nr:LemA family protein [Actinomycetota bacterium]
MSLAAWIAVAVVVLVVVWAIWAFNRLVKYRNRVDEGWSQIDVQLRRRYDLIPNLVAAVRGYAAHERTVFEVVTKARAQAETASGVAGQADAENAVTSGLRQLLAVAENYPDLRANENFLALQEELTGTESKIAYARQYYNDQVRLLNTAIQSFPSSVLAGVFHFTAREFFDIDDAERGPVHVGFEGS